MTRHCYKPTSAPPAAGPYSSASRVDNIVATAGQCGYTKDGTLLEGFDNQARQALDNIFAALAEAGAGQNDVIKMNAYISDPNDFAAINAVYEDYLEHPYPARTTVTAGLRPGVLIEFDALAVVTGR